MNNYFPNNSSMKFNLADVSTHSVSPPSRTWLMILPFTSRTAMRSI